MPSPDPSASPSANPRSSGPQSAEPAGYVELLAGNAKFRRFFAARLTSLLGDWFNTFAVLALLRTLGEVDARSFGWVLILKTLPALFVTPLAGVLVDRSSRKRLLVGLDLLRAGVVAAMLGLVLVPRVELLYLLVILQTAASAIAEPARTAVLPDLVREADLVTANALGAAAWSTMLTVGAALGGVVTAQLGWQVALGIDVATYLVSAGLMASLPIPPPRPRESGDRGSFRDGLRYLRARPRVWTLALAKTGWCLSGATVLVLTLLGERTYPWGPGGLLSVSLLYMARGIGTGLGPIVSRALCGYDPVKLERAIGWGYLWGGLLYLGVGTTQLLPLGALLVCAAHLGGATVWVFSTVRLQMVVPSEVRGRVFACEQGGFTLMTALTTYAFGAGIDAGWFPLPEVASGLGAALLLPAGLWWLRGRLLGFGNAETS